MSLIQIKDFQTDHEKFKKVLLESLDSGNPLEQALGWARSAAEPVAGRWAVHSVKECYCCGEKLVVPFIFWNGTHDLGFHIDCARSFLIMLGRDVIEHDHGRERANEWYCAELEKPKEEVK
jgi:hypothetical protein